MKTLQLRSFTILAGLVFMMSACEKDNPVELTPIDPIPIPTDLFVRVGATELTLNWAFDSSYGFTGFAIYRSDDNRQTFDRIAEVSAPPHNDANVQVGFIYWYRVAGIDANGLEGRSSISIAANAAVYQVFINGGLPVTGSRDVTLSFTAPPSTQNVRFDTDSLTLENGPWRDFLGSTPFILSPGDGIKPVYAQFLDQTGNATHVVSTSIRMDTYAEISSMGFSCLQGCVAADTISPGGTIRFTVTPVGNELNGQVEIFIEGRGDTPVVARDNGTYGDAIAGDGVYAVDHVFPQFFRERSMRMSAAFIDAAFNPSPELEFTTTLIMTDPPAAVSLFPPTDSTATSVSLRWTRSSDPHFARYEIYRDTSLPVTPERSILAGTVSQISTTVFVDSPLAGSTQYYYQVYVVNDMGERAGSQIRTGNTL